MHGRHATVCTDSEQAFAHASGSGKEGALTISIASQAILASPTDITERGVGCSSFWHQHTRFDVGMYKIL
jgi:hypothetical protein